MPPQHCVCISLFDHFPSFMSLTLIGFMYSRSVQKLKNTRKPRILEFRVESSLRVF